MERNSSQSGGLIYNHTSYTMSLLPPNNFRGQVPMTQAAQHRYMPKQPEVVHFLGNSGNYHPCPPIENWTSTNAAAGVMPFHHPDYQFNPWSAGSTHGYSPEPSQAPMQHLPEVASHQYHFSVSQPTDVPAMAISHPHTVPLKPERRSFNICEDHLDWVS